MHTYHTLDHCLGFTREMTKTEFQSMIVPQVLNMAVDDADLQLDFSSNNHAFNFQNVQYLSKDNGKMFLHTSLTT